MKSFLPFACLLGFVASASALDLRVRLDADASSGWKFVGIDGAKIPSGEPFLLPADAQAARRFDSKDIEVRLSMEMDIGIDPAEWPVLEIGGAGLTFMKVGAVVRAVLMFPDGKATALPPKFALNTGTVIEKCPVSIRRTEQAIAISAGAWSGTYRCEPEAAALEVVFSAPLSRPWVLEGAEVVVRLPDTDQVSSDPIQPDGGSRTVTDYPLNAPLSLSVTNRRSDLENLPAHATNASEKTTAGAHSATLEVFTPPSVRSGRAAVVRATAANLSR